MKPVSSSHDLPTECMSALHSGINISEAAHRDSLPASKATVPAALSQWKQFEGLDLSELEPLLCHINLLPQKRRRKRWRRRRRVCSAPGPGTASCSESGSGRNLNRSLLNPKGDHDLNHEQKRSRRRFHMMKEQNSLRIKPHRTDPGAPCGRVERKSHCAAEWTLDLWIRR
ncbi:unnamed protein product [Pleuronectes platessa]|uniref:Uncharacterized protein n=1 Tax=Pleuronectes platessa TaxID=8262 RepID=A0A9N7YAV1_PLEPL|nr:unnamed protein product [Pleuronectes platessa]